MKDATVRKYWLVFVILNSVIGLCVSLQTLYVLAPFGGKAMALMLGIPLVFQAFFLWIYYHCAYKNPGTKLLTFSLVSTTYFLLISLPFLKEHLPSKLPFASSFMSVQNSTPQYLWSFFSGALMIFLSWKLLQVNKRIRFDRLQSDPSSQEILSILQGTNTLKQLNLKFGECVRKYPQHHFFAKQAHKKHKALLCQK